LSGFSVTLDPAPVLLEKVNVPFWGTEGSCTGACSLLQPASITSIKAGIIYFVFTVIS